MITESKYLKLAFKVLSALCIIAVGVCFICDFAINKHVTWSAFPMAIIPIIWAVATPALLAKKGKVVLSLSVLTVVLLPMLYVLRLLLPYGDWFTPLGLPLAIVTILSAWITFCILKFLKLNKWYMSAIIVFLYGIVINSVIRYFVNSFLYSSFFTLDVIINLVSCAAVGALLVVIGHGKK